VTDDDTVWRAGNPNTHVGRLIPQTRDVERVELK